MSFFPWPLGQKVKAQSASVVISTEQEAILSSVDANLGAKADAAATTDAGTFSLIALFKRWLERFTVFLSRFPAALGHRIPAGFLTDAATTPRLLWPLFPPVGKWTRSAILHDYLLTSRTRREADSEFLLALTECDGIHPAVARLMWAGVSLRTLFVTVFRL